MTSATKSSSTCFRQLSKTLHWLPPMFSTCWPPGTWSASRTTPQTSPKTSYSGCAVSTSVTIDLTRLVSVAASSPSSSCNRTFICSLSPIKIWSSHFPRSTEQNLTDTPQYQPCGRVCCVTPIGWHRPVPATLSLGAEWSRWRLPGCRLGALTDSQYSSSCKNAKNILKEE